jgi:hypothetical protein
MKFEANIPSYLRTGQGVFPVKERSIPKPQKETNFYELAKKGFNMPVANDTEGTSFAPIADKKTKEPMDVENFLDKMQRMEVNPKLDINLDTRPVMPQIKPGIMKEPTERMVEKENEDVFIG